MSQLRPRSAAPSKNPGRPADPASRSRLTDWLEQAIAPLEQALMRQPVMKAIHDGTVSRDDYLRVLQGLLAIHLVAEKTLDMAVHLKALNRDEFRRSEVLRQDLRILRGRIPVRTDAAVDRFESQARRWVEAPCLGLAGFLFVMERSRRAPGRRVAALSRALGAKLAPRNGLDYHLEGAETAGRRFQQLGEFLTAGVRSSTRAKELRDGCVETMNTLIKLHEPPARR